MNVLNHFLQKLDKGLLSLKSQIETEVRKKTLVNLALVMNMYITVL